MKKNGKPQFMITNINVKMMPELKQLVASDADKNFLPMNEIIVQILAEHYRRPDLSSVPRKAIGRPRKEIVVNGKHAVSA